MSELSSAEQFGQMLKEALDALNVNIVIAVDEMSNSDPNLAERISARLQKVIDSNQNLSKLALSQHENLIDLLKQTAEES